MSRVLSIAAAVFLAFPLSPLSGQGRSASEQASFFAALASEFSSEEVFAVDTRSFADRVSEHFGWAIAPDEVQELLGEEFRYGPLELFLSCEADMPCVLVEPGIHVALARVAAVNGTSEVTLRLDRTGDEDAAVRRRFGVLTLRRSEGEWQVVDRRIVGVPGQASRGIPSHAQGARQWTEGVIGQLLIGRGQPLVGQTT